MGQTATYLLPYPELDEPDDVPADVKELADRLEIVLPTFEQIAKYGQPSGYCPLGADGKVPAAYLPTVAVQTTTVVRKVTLKDVANNAGKVDLFNGEITIPANVLTATGRANFVAGGDYLNNTGSNRSLDLFFDQGATGLWDSGPVNIPSNALRRTWRLAGEIIPTSATTAHITGFFAMGSAIGAPRGSGTFGDTSASSTGSYLGPMLQNDFTITLTAAIPFAFSLQHAVASGQLSMRLRHVRVEVYG